MEAKNERDSCFEKSKGEVEPGLGRQEKKRRIGPPSPITKSPGPVGLDLDIRKAQAHC
jgi:hypothetical protein